MTWNEFKSILFYQVSCVLVGRDCKLTAQLSRSGSGLRLSVPATGSSCSARSQEKVPQMDWLPEVGPERAIMDKLWASQDWHLFLLLHQQPSPDASNFLSKLKPWSVVSWMPGERTKVRGNLSTTLLLQSQVTYLILTTTTSRQKLYYYCNITRWVSHKPTVSRHFYSRRLPLLILKYSQVCVLSHLTLSWGLVGSEEEET